MAASTMSIYENVSPRTTSTAYLEGDIVLFSLFQKTSIGARRRHFMLRNRNIPGDLLSIVPAGHAHFSEVP